MYIRYALAILALASLTVVGRAHAQSPVVTFSTYLGGSGNENLRDIATDSAGNMYVTGGTSSADFPTTPGAYDRTFATGGTSLGTGGPMDVFVTKLTPDGQVVWSTLLGGPNYDRAYAIEVDRMGNVYVAGRAGEGFPTTPGVVQPVFAGDVSPNSLYGKQDPFIAKLSPDGSTLVWATYFGANDAGIIRDFDIDSVGNVFIVSPGAVSAHPHITAGSFGVSKPGGNDMVVAKISSDATRVVWAGYVGGTSNDGGGPSIRVDPDGYAYFIGTTTSADLPVTANAYDRTFNGGTDFMIGKVVPDGSALAFLTYVGGSGSEDLETHNIALDRAGNVYVCGYTSSTDLPVTPGVVQSMLGGGNDIPLVKLANDGSQLLACSYLGGTAGDGSQGIGVSEAGDVVVGGASQSANFPLTSNAFQRIQRGQGDMVVAVLSGDFSVLKYSTLVGGSVVDDGRTAWMDRDGTFYLAGHSSSPDFPTANRVHSHAGNHDGIIVRFADITTTADTAFVSLRDDCRWIREDGGLFGVYLERTGRMIGEIQVAVRLSGPAGPLDLTIPFDTRMFDGESSVMIPLTAINDTLVEGVEHVTATITSVTGDVPVRAVGRTSADIWIVDDDVANSNILVNPGFESDSAWQRATNGGRTIDPNTALFGRRSLRMLGSNQFPREVYQHVPVRAGATYLAGGWIYIQRYNSARAKIELHWLDDTGGVVGAPVTVTDLTGTHEWTWVSVCASAPAEADSVRFRLLTTVEEDNESQGYFDNLELVEAVEGVSSAALPPSTDHGITHRIQPNPTSAGATLSFRLDRSADVRLEVVDMSGRVVVSRAFDDVRDAVVRLDLSAVPAGTYAYRLRASDGASIDLARGNLIVLPR